MADYPRMMDPGVFTSELAAGALEKGLNPAEVICFFAYTWTHADDTGVFRPKVNTIRMRSLPHISFEVAEKIYKYILSCCDYIEFRTKSQITYVYIPKLHTYQPLDHPRKPKQPYPPKKLWTKKHYKIFDKWGEYEGSDDTTEHFSKKPNKTEKVSKQLPNRIDSVDRIDIIEKDILSFWNLQDIIKHKDIKKHLPKLKEAIKIHSEEEIKNAIANYGNILKRPDLYFWKYKWELHEFLSRGLDKFLTENKPMENFAINKGPINKKPEEELSAEQRQLKANDELNKNTST